MCRDCDLRELRDTLYQIAYPYNLAMRQRNTLVWIVRQEVAQRAIHPGSFLGIHARGHIAIWQEESESFRARRETEFNNAVAAFEQRFGELSRREKMALWVWRDEATREERF